MKLEERTHEETTAGITSSAAIPSNNVTANPSLITFGRIRKYQIEKKYQDRIRSIFGSYLSNALNAKGNIIAEVYTDDKDVSNIWIIERWESKTLADKYDTSTHAENLDELTKAFAAAQPEVILVKDLEPLSKDEWLKTVNTADEAIILMLFMHVNEGTQTRFKSLWHDAMAVLRNNDGIPLFQLAQFQDNDTRFVTFEKFRNNAAFQAHLKYSLIAPILDFLHDSIQDPPFEDHFYTLKKFRTTNVD